MAVPVLAWPHPSAQHGCPRGSTSLELDVVTLGACQLP